MGLGGISALVSVLGVVVSRRVPDNVAPLLAWVGLDIAVFIAPDLYVDSAVRSTLPPHPFGPPSPAAVALSLVACAGLLGLVLACAAPTTTPAPRLRSRP